MEINIYWFFLIGSVVIASLSQVLLKKSAQKEHESFVKEYFNPYVIIGYCMMVISTILTILAYRGIAYKNGPVIEAMGYILIMFLSLIFFGEKITRRKLLGNILILVGIFVFYL